MGGTNVRTHTQPHTHSISTKQACARLRPLRAIKCAANGWIIYCAAAVTQTEPSFL